MANFQEEYAKLTIKEQHDFASAINYLLSKSFLIATVYDMREKTFKNNPIYAFVDRHFEVMNDYLSFSSWILERDYQLGVIFLQNLKEENLLKFDRFTSVLIFALRRVYDLEKQNSTSGSLSVRLTTISFVNYLTNEFGIHQIAGRKISKSGTLFKDAFRILVNKNIIERLSGSFDDGSATINILPSILFIINPEAIRRMEDKLRQIEEKRGGGEE